MGVLDFSRDGWASFAALWACVYGVLLFLYFALGLILQAMNRRHPERRIQSRAPSDARTDIRQSLASLAMISVYVAGGLFAQANGWTLFAPLELSWWSAPLTFAASIILYDAWFYWFHRLMHTKLLFRFHAQHHKSIAPTPWSNNNDTFVGTFFEQVYFLIIPFVLPLPALVLIAHKIWDQVTGMIGHAGYEFFASPSAREPWPMICTTFHDQHHAFFRCNYANTFSFWDRVMGTLHPKYDDKVRYFEKLSMEADMPAVADRDK